MLDRLPHPQNTISQDPNAFPNGEKEAKENASPPVWDRFRVTSFVLFLLKSIHIYLGNEMHHVEKRGPRSNGGVPCKEEQQLPPPPPSLSLVCAMMFKVPRPGRLPSPPKPQCLSQSSAESQMQTNSSIVVNQNCLRANDQSTYHTPPLPSQNGLPWLS